jgi:hypothetical protein
MNQLNKYLPACFVGVVLAVTFVAIASAALTV